MNTQNLIHAAAFCLALPFASATHAAIVDGTVAFNPSSTNVNVGDTFTLDVWGKGFTSSLDGGSFNFGFDGNVVRVDSVALDTGTWEFAPSVGTTSNAPAGSVSGVEFNTFLHNPIGDFKIATITFTALTLGTSSLDLSAGLNPYGSGGTPLNVGFQAGTINAVPLPPSLLIMASSLASLMLIGRRKVSADV